ncbi:uncharacterized protein LOC115959035 isoform X2 [Quercus lobata]|uniref:Uncharacterized protein n=1 Tax=Quercus lobata TaxID=97700 RepID=A0A7N2MMG4_QUELO|nr:uncharacterized protein LOC115959035 isoform X2 [Quercus lobata]
MSKQEIEEEKMSKTQNGVIISVYVESPKIGSPQRTRTAAIKKSTNKPKSSSSSVSKKPQIAARKKGFDRRAQLLAYARELRNAGSQEAQRPKLKKWKWLTIPMSLCFPSRRILERTSSRWRYERIPTEVYTENIVDSSCGSECISGKKRRAIKRIKSHFFVKLSKLRCMLKELSCSCKNI